jgi:phosphate transport system protein
VRAVGPRRIDRPRSPGVHHPVGGSSPDRTPTSPNVRHNVPVADDVRRPDQPDGGAVRIAYHERLLSLIDQLAEMTRLVASAMARANAALLDADLELAEKVIAADQLVDARREAIDDEAVQVLALESPVAGELRLVVAVLRMAATVERMGDLAVHVAKVARLRYPESAVPAELRGTILEMGHIAERLVQKAGSALSTHDSRLAAEVELDDDAMDAKHRLLFTMLLDDAWTHGVESAVDIALLSRYYERFADHAVSLARRVAFDVSPALARAGLDDSEANGA